MRVGCFATFGGTADDAIRFRAEATDANGKAVVWCFGNTAELAWAGLARRLADRLADGNSVTGENDG